jgi:hypothetical protein
MDLHFSYKLGGVTQFGAGHTLDLSRGAVRFATENPPPNGADVELRIAWPYLLQNVCPLELVVRGTTATPDGRRTVLNVSDYEFRTCGQRSFDQAVRGIGGGSIMA